MRLSIIIPCFNVEDVIGDQLHALSQQEWEHDWEIIIADNGSNENIGRIVDTYKDKLPDILIVDSTEKKGPAYARNCGVRHARGEYLAFVDADDMVSENWIRHMGEALIRYDFVASNLDLSKLSLPNVLESSLYNRYIGLKHSGVVRYLPYASTTGLGIRKKIHELIGGFDEDMQAAEDADYCWRVQLAGYKLHLYDEAIIYYRRRNTLWKSFKQVMHWGEYDVLLYKKFQKYNIPKQNKKKALREWLNLFKKVPKLIDSNERIIWIRNFGQKLGRLKGSLKYRIFVP